MDEALLVRMLDGPANLNEQVQALASIEMVLVAVVGDLDAAHEFHDKIRAAGLGGTGIEHAGDIGMIHQGERLTFSLKAGDNAFGIHAQLDDLEGDPAVDGFFLVGHEHHAAAAFADFLEQLVIADAGAQAFQGGVRAGRRRSRSGGGGFGEQLAGKPGGRGAGHLKKTVGFRAGGEQ